MDQHSNQQNDLQDQVIDYTQFPDAKGHFGIHGGRFVSETLMAALEDLENLYNRMKTDEKFLAITDVEEDSKYDYLLDYQIQLLQHSNNISIINTSLMFLKDYNTGLFNQYVSFS